MKKLFICFNCFPAFTFSITTAERAGFEPAKHFWRLHAFQACLFNHSSISPYFGLHNTIFFKIGCKLQRKSGIASDFSYKCILFFRLT